MKRIQEGEVWVFPRYDNTIDVWTGKGWANHSVFKIFRGGYLRFFEGAPLSEQHFKTLKALV